MNKTIEQVTAELEKDLPKSVVKGRTQGGAQLSYVDTFYVIKRLNECFGNLGWDSETVRLEQVTPGNKDRNGNELIAYRALVRITAIVATGDGGYMKVVKEGTGWGSDKSQLNPHEMASKEAESDALKRAAMKFGMSLGLALYDKTQEHIEDDAAEVKQEQPKPQSPAINRNNVNQLITKTSTVILDIAGPSGSPERDAKVKELKALIAAYGVDSKEKLTDSQALELANKLKEMTNAK